ncbi:hypothetical protein DXT96_06815 [Agrobacterium sp. ICMP 6402]|uniref:hypothetical protein n=1 Tax=Agrobacterium sp. ICMP 6402 TaxID=2292443 RepID=UPI001296E372|nr:hypothetical protein [Agrobacterium sp. ICMP 6402]MQB09566.1 hypothetical protein [Agrobacterium sp. ICMP 6402]
MADTNKIDGPGPLRVVARERDRQFGVESDYNKASGEWEDIYVSFTGYFGSYGPNVFAAAPDLLAALKAMDEALCNGFDTKEHRASSRKALFDARTAIAKAEGRS